LKSVKSSVPVSHLPLLHQQAGWIGLKSVNGTGDHSSGAVYLTSLESDANCGACCLHWGIENQLHWTLDVTLQKSRVRTMPQNLALLDASRSSRVILQTQHTAEI